ncbi:MAG: heavy metal transporter [Ekhidna sp.]|uniref:heavy metal transporter n=1 Tax=Ekhidna sp. TaxID=2608089 RepID=UPI0032EC4C08
MTKTIRSTYPRDVSIGMLIIVFGLVFFLAGQLFEKNQPDNGFTGFYLGEFLVSVAVLVMILILWEEILFPVKIKPMDDGLIFRNHRSKLKIQAIIYLIIPVIVTFLYLTHEVNLYRFLPFAAVCLALPVIGKLVSGINNYNDFLTLTGSYIDFKDNEHEGKIPKASISRVEMIKEEGELHQLKVELKDGDLVVIEVHQMELEVFFESIEEYINEHYKNLLK